jgi:23S rRNA (uracil1939-C5)-methyltransferase
VAGERGLAAESFECDDARAAAARWARAGVRLDAVVCDPPRAGLGSSAPWAARLAKRWLVLCSCRPEALCADLRRIVGEGFAIEALSLFDMFPQTRHVEAVAWLERRHS